MTEPVIHCALVERTFRFHWPKGLRPTDWFKLGDEVEEELGGGEFNSFTGLRSSWLKIASKETDNAIIDKVSEIIKRHLPEDKSARLTYWGTVAADENWKE